MIAIDGWTPHFPVSSFFTNPTCHSRANVIPIPSFLVNYRHLLLAKIEGAMDQSEALIERHREEFKMVLVIDVFFSEVYTSKEDNHTQ